MGVYLNIQWVTRPIYNVLGVIDDKKENKTKNYNVINNSLAH